MGHDFPDAGIDVLLPGQGFTAVQIEIEARGAVHGEQAQPGGKRITDPRGPACTSLFLSGDQFFKGHPEGQPAKVQIPVDFLHELPVEFGAALLDGLCHDFQVEEKRLQPDKPGMADRAPLTVMLDGSVFGETILSGDFLEVLYRLIEQCLLPGTHYLLHFAIP